MSSNLPLTPNNLTQALCQLESYANDIRELLLFQARDAAESGETGWLVQVSGDAKAVEECVSKLEIIGRSLHEILTNTLGFEDEKGMTPVEQKHWAEKMEVLNDDASAPHPKRLRRIRTEITQGEINQNLLTLTAARKRGYIRIGEQFKIRLPDGQEFETVLLGAGNKLRERGRIRDFYRQQNIKAGDVVLLEEIDPGVWTLTKAIPTSPRSESDSAAT